MRFEILREGGLWYWRIVTSEDGRTVATSTDGYDYPGDALRVINWIPTVIADAATRVRIFNSAPNSGYVEVGLATAKGMAAFEADGDPTVDAESILEPSASGHLYLEDDFGNPIRRVDQ